MILNMSKGFWKILAFIFIVLYGCAGFAGSGKVAPNDTHTARIDPAIRIDLEEIKSGGNPEREIDVLIRTERELTAAEKAALEKEGAKISSSIGNVLSARVPLGSIEKISRLEFVTYIEKAKKERLR